MDKYLILCKGGAEVKSSIRSKVSQIGIAGAISLICLAHATAQQVDRGSSQQSPPFSDSVAFRLFVKGALVATVQNSIDERGTYKRVFTLSAGAQTLEMRMNVVPDENRDWKRIEIVNPTIANILAERSGNTVRYLEKGIQKTITIPEKCVLFDDYGTVYESLMLRQYDMGRKGIQKFNRFRIPESPLPGNIISVEVEYLGEEQRPGRVGGKTFRKFSWALSGMKAVYWVDQEFKIYIVESPVEQAVSVREGFEELMRPTRPDQPGFAPGSSPGKQTIEVPVRDGVNLSTDLYLPKDSEQRFPLILLRTPYKKETMEFIGSFYSARGYAVAIQDVRGRCASQGKWEPFVNEAEDGFDAIEWLANQHWCNGKVGMLGGSYLASAQFLAAKLKPPHLVTIIPYAVPGDPFCNGPYEYGSFLLMPELWWTGLTESTTGGELTQEKFKEIEAIKKDERLSSLPVVDLDKKILGKEVPHWRKWIAHNLNDAYWTKASYAEALKELNIPVLLQSGWFDTQSIGTKLAYEALRSSGNKNVKMVVGPWNHVNQVPSTPSTRNVGDEAKVDFLELYLRWFDHWLKEIGNEVMSDPLVQVYCLNSRQWTKTNSYPLPHTQFTRLYLSSLKRANTLRGDGKLQWNTATAGSDHDAFKYDPADPTPAPAYRFKNGRKGFDEITSTRNDILVYESEPLTNALTILGPISATIYASSSAVDTDWYVTLYAVTEKDEHVQMVRGAIRARFRNSTAKPELLIPGRICEYSIDLWHFGIRLERGWKLRTEIASAYFPEFSRNLNTGGHNEMENAYVKADQKIYHSAEHPSHILLPLIPSE